MTERFALFITPTGIESLAGIRDKKLRSTIGGVISTLEVDPAARGKALSGLLIGVRSVRAARDRYRILYEVDDGARVVHVLWIGVRRPGRSSDVYQRAAAALRRLTGKPGR